MFLLFAITGGSAINKIAVFSSTLSELPAIIEVRVSEIYHATRLATNAVHIQAAGCYTSRYPRNASIKSQPNIVAPITPDKKFLNRISAGMS